MKKANPDLSLLQPTQQGFSSVSTPTAQTTRLCSVRKPAISALMANASNFFKSTNYPDDIKAITWLLMDSGIRISEALNIAPYHVLESRKIKVIGLKGSSDRIISITNYQEFWESYRRSKCYLNDVYSRFFFYRLFKKHGLQLTVNSSCRQAVTHSFRHAFIQELKREGVESELSQKVIGHKSLSNTLRYEK